MKFTVIMTGILVLAGSACTRSQSPEPELLKTATIKDIMDSMVDPSADFLFESVAEIANADGITHKGPRTTKEWEEVRRRTLVLLEAPNLLIMKGRRVANPGEKAENPGIELEADKIQAMVDGDRPSFVRRAQRLQDAAGLALKAADAKDREALFHALEDVDKACESCHLKYWYPNDKRAQEAAKQNGLVN